MCAIGLILLQIYASMNLRPDLKLLLVLAMLAMGLLTACEEEDDDETLPTDDGPSIARLQPSSASILDTNFTSLTLQYNLADNEQLAYYTLRLEIPSQGVSQVLEQDSLMGTELSRSYTYQPADTFPEGQTDIFFTAYVFDNQGLADSNQFRLQVVVLPEDTCTNAFQYNILTYGRDTIYNGAETMGRSSFNLIQRQYAMSDAASDIREGTDNTGQFARMFISPNTAPQPVFLTFTSSQFNYDRASWCTIEQAFRTHTPSQMTRELSAGDVVLLDMDLPPDDATPNKQHYAAIHILEVVDTPDDSDYIVFEYKRTENED